MPCHLVLFDPESKTRSDYECDEANTAHAVGFPASYDPNQVYIGVMDTTDAAINDIIKDTAAFGEAANAGNLDAMKAVWTKVAQDCGACHGGPSKSGGKFRFEE